MKITENIIPTTPSDLVLTSPLYSFREARIKQVPKKVRVELIPLHGKVKKIKRGPPLKSNLSFNKALTNKLNLKERLI